MTSTTDLSDGLAHALGLPNPTVALHTRNLREAGLLTRGGRGRSAARMTPGDAASLLIAVAGADQVQGSAEALRRFGGLVAEGRRSSLPGLGAGHTFLEAIAEFIRAFRDRDLTGADGLTIDVSLTRPLAAAQIQIWISDGQSVAQYITGPNRVRDRQPAGDLKIVTSFTQAALGQIGELLRS